MLRELHLTGNPDADKLLNDDPFALLVGMLLDQQYPMEHAFSGPLKIANRMDGFDLHKIAATDLETFVELSVTPPAIHRYGGSMARRVHALAQEIIEKYDGETANIWLSGRPKPDGAEVLKRLAGAARIRRAEGEDLPGPARQAARRGPEGLARGRGQLRRPRLPPLHRRRHRRRLPRRGPLLQEGRKGSREGLIGATVGPGLLQAGRGSQCGMSLVLTRFPAKSAVRTYGCYGRWEERGWISGIWIAGPARCSGKS